MITSFLLVDCANILEPLTPKDSNKALLYEAKKQIDAGNFTAALEAFSDMDPDFAAQNEVRLTHASAFAGACGMQFIPFFSGLTNANFDPPNTFFKTLRGTFTDKTATPDYCRDAEKKLKEIGSTQALRLAAMNGSHEINMLMAILAMAKVGAILRTTSDTDGTNSLGDGTTDAGFDSCSSTSISDDDVVDVATGFGLINENLPTLLGASSNTAVALQVIAAAISPLCNLPDSSKCLVLDGNDIADNTQRAEIINTFRDLLAIKGFGLGSCDLPTLPDDCCP